MLDQSALTSAHIGRELGYRSENAEPHKDNPDSAMQCNNKNCHKIAKACHMIANALGYIITQSPKKIPPMLTPLG
eukprot:m.140685 g.140685  ORF g.140685 m.140685 type:complete len:75 (+) comp32310_c0_seq1:90-314(+)